MFQYILSLPINILLFSTKSVIQFGKQLKKIHILIK